MKLFCLLCLILTLSLAQAQNESKTRNFFIGGDIGIDLTNRSGIDSNFVQLTSPNEQDIDLEFITHFGYEIRPKYAVGVEVGFSRSISDRQSNTSSGFSVNNKYRIKIFGRYVFNPQDRFSFYTRIATSYFAGVNKNGVSNAKRSSIIQDLSANIGLGFQYNINDRLRFTGYVFTLGYSFEKYQKINTDIQDSLDYAVSSSFGFNTFNNYPQFGLEYRFQRPSKRKLKQ
jgi:Outer membrane protein beta-barrel domain